MRLDVKLVAPTKKMTVLSGPRGVEELVTHYVHAADVLTVPKNVERLEQDIGGIITLRVAFKINCSTGLHTNNPITYKGFYAYGVEGKGGVVFQAYVGHKSVTSDFPSKCFENAIAEFMLRLIKHEYYVMGVDYKLHPSRN